MHRRSTNTRDQALRVAGLKNRSIDLKVIERRRLQVWGLMALLLVALSVVVALGALWPDLEQRWPIDPVTLRLAIVVLSLSFSAYVFEKERSLRVLTRALLDERERHGRLDVQVRRLHALVADAQAIGVPLDRERLASTALTYAVDLVAADGGAVSLGRGDELQLCNVHGHGVHDVVDVGRAAEHAARTHSTVVQGDRSRGTGGYSGVAVPVLAGERLLGVLDLRTESRRIDDVDVEVLGAFGRHVGAALSSLERRDEMQRSRTQPAEDLGAAWSELQDLAGRRHPAET